MSDHHATVTWRRDGQKFVDHNYSRGHDWTFDGGLNVPASASPQVVPLPMSVAENVDPEEAFVAALSSCHMLFFLSIAAKRGFIVDEYVDDAVGIMARDDQGREALVSLTLQPKVRFSGDKLPSLEQQEKMHHRSHELCFLANSVKTRIETKIQNTN